mmetsp:Transcript_27620/g.84757  ORF Transcript_27620/g.84757 Transcript_27620/m.84757 type:complete len:218 (-) Transcript_27620:573-1226(-)
MANAGEEEAAIVVDANTRCLLTGGGGGSGDSGGRELLEGDVGVGVGTEEGLANGAGHGHGFVVGRFLAPRLASLGDVGDELGGSEAAEGAGGQGAREREVDLDAAGRLAPGGFRRKGPRRFREAAVLENEHVADVLLGRRHHRPGPDPLLRVRRRHRHHLRLRRRHHDRPLFFRRQRVRRGLDDVVWFPLGVVGLRSHSVRRDRFHGQRRPLHRFDL